jgi:hypothetical protein
MQCYVTRDYYLAAYLIAKGCGLRSHTKNDRTTMFSFDATDQVDDLVKDYYEFQATINPISYGNAMRTLKTIIQLGHNYAINSQPQQSRKVN